MAPSQSGRRPDHLVVINRWTGGTAAYADYLDHHRQRVTYIVGPLAAAAVPTAAADVEVVPLSRELVLSEADESLIEAALARLVHRHGPIHRLVALHEGDLEVAARLRQRWNVDGDRPCAVEVFRDKATMAKVLADHGIATPRTVVIRSADDVRALAGAVGYPVIVKPRRGTASGGVRLLYSTDELPADLPLDGSQLAQPFVAGSILHVDGYFDGERLGAWSASRYLGTCLQFESWAALGSVEIDDPVLAGRIADFTTDVLRALSPFDPRVFHAEIFDPSDDATALSLLEIGARTGGAEIAPLWRELHGIDLVAVACALQTGTDIPAAARRPRWAGGGEDEIGGWLLLPPVADRPCTVVEATREPSVAGAYWRGVPEVGTVVPRGGGYERSAARFRFRGNSSAAVLHQLRCELAATTFECRTQPARDLVLLGTGAQAFREYGLPSVAARARIRLRHDGPRTWATGYVDSRVPATDVGATAARPDGVLTWDEPAVEAAAGLAERWGLPGIGLQAARDCRDKLRTREILAAAGAPAVAFRHARNLAAAHRAAHEIGFPVVLKPRSLAGSAGVVLVRSDDELPDAHRTASGARFPGLGGHPGVLVEEYLDGPEISVDSAVRDGKAIPLNVARKVLGPPPCFEEIGHRVLGWRHEPWAGAVSALVEQAHRLLGVRDGVTHAEIRLTNRGPRLVELNCRLGGDLIPYLGYLATGIDLVGVATDIALGVAPQLAATRDRAAVVDFVYPDEDCTIRSVDVTAAAAVPHIERAVCLAEPGTRLLLPPRGVVPRAALLVAVADTEAECVAAIKQARAAVRIDAEPLAALAAATV